MKNQNAAPINETTGRPVEVHYPDSFSEKTTVLATVDPASVDIGAIEPYAYGNYFSPKQEFHFTIIGDSVGKQIEAMLADVPARQRTDVEDSLNGALQLLRQARLKNNDYYWLVKDFDYGERPERRESIIQGAEIDGSEDFYRTVGELTAVDLGTPFPHLTLYTKGTGPDAGIGIGVRSLEYLQTLEHYRIEPLA